MKSLENKKILITGGSGFLGTALIKKLKKSDVRIISRDESLQEKVKERFSHVRCILGDIRDYEAILDATKDVDYVIHAAAVKYVDWAQEQPTDCVKTNIFGSMNVIRACIENKVKVCVGCSTDKAPYSRNVYGCSKQIMEALFKEANAYKRTKFVITRYGNVIGSTGSVIPKWKEARDRGDNLLVTGKDMFRFFMTVEDAADLVLKALRTKKTIIPDNLKAINMWKLAEAIVEDKKRVKEIPPRPGERPYEVLIADYEGEMFSTINADKFTIKEIKKLI